MINEKDLRIYQDYIVNNYPYRDMKIINNQCITGMQQIANELNISEETAWIIWRKYLTMKGE